MKWILIIAKIILEIIIGKLKKPQNPDKVQNQKMNDLLKEALNAKYDLIDLKNKMEQREIEGENIEEIAKRLNETFNKK